jgi:CheY-like chemotaxis protein
MARRSERDLSLSDAERLGGGLPIGVRLRVAMELLRSLADDSTAVSTPRTAGSRLFFDRVTLSSGDAVCATGPGDLSGAALLVWEICAGRPLGAETPVRLHEIVDDMPADVDDVVMGALRAGAPPATAAELLDELSRAGPAGAPSSRAKGSTRESTNYGSQVAGGRPPPAPGAVADSTARPRPEGPRENTNGAVPSSKRAARSPSNRAPAATQSRRATPPASKRASKTSATLPSMKAVVPPAGYGAEPGSGGRSPIVGPAASRVPSPSLLLIHAGEEGQSLADALRAAGYPVVVHGDAASCLAHAIAENPVCVLCDSDLPDGDGEAVVRRIRQQPSAVADAPFVLLTARGDTRQRVARFGAGADVCLLKPITIAALIQQVDALVDMASRLRAAHHARSALPRAYEAAALTGDIRQVGIAAVLTILEMERRTGSFVATIAEIDANDRPELELDLARGCVAGASAMGVPARPVEVVRAMMRLAVGRFAFKPTTTPRR